MESLLHYFLDEIASSAAGISLVYSLTKHSENPYSSCNIKPRRSIPCNICRWFHRWSRREFFAM